MFSLCSHLILHYVLTTGAETNFWDLLFPLRNTRTSNCFIKGNLSSRALLLSNWEQNLTKLVYGFNKLISLNDANFTVSVFRYLRCITFHQTIIFILHKAYVTQYFGSLIGSEMTKQLSAHQKFIEMIYIFLAFNQSELFAWPCPPDRTQS